MPYRPPSAQELALLNGWHGLFPGDPVLFCEHGGLSGEAGPQPLHFRRAVDAECHLHQVIAHKDALIAKGGLEAYLRFRNGFRTQAQQLATQLSPRELSWLWREYQTLSAVLGQRGTLPDAERERRTIEATILKKQLARAGYSVIQRNQTPELIRQYNPDQPRDGRGRFAAGGGHAIASAKLSDPLQSAAFARAIHDPAYGKASAYVPGVGDPFLRDLLHEQGFDGPPHVVSKAEMDDLVVKGEPELWRGFSQAAHIDQFVSGPLYVGRGTGGSGTYVAVQKALATEYARGGMLRMTLKAGVRTVSVTQLGELRSRYLAEHPPLGNPKADEALMNILYNNGRFAAWLGYDAISDPSMQEMIILNRTALRVQQQ